MKIKVNDLLFEGFVIDCDVKDTAGVAVCKEIKENAEKFGMPVVAPNKYLFSLWGTVRLSHYTLRPQGRKVPILTDTVTFNSKTNF